MFMNQLWKSFAQNCLTISYSRSRNTISHRIKLSSLNSASILSTNEEDKVVLEKQINSVSKLNYTQVIDKRWGESAKSMTTKAEQEFLVRVKNDPDTFGHPEEVENSDEGDILEEKHSTEQVLSRKKLSTKQYADLIKQYIRQRRIKEAIDVLEVRMLKEDKVKPEAYIYNLLLGACGRVGYTKKAFMLYNQMKQRGLNVMGGTYTALFNACANSPWPVTDGLSRARHLYNIMVEKGYQPNDTNYNAMIKAFGRCGDLPMAFKLVDEMVQSGYSIKNDTISFLLQACISDKESGFRHSLLVWRKVVEKNITPNLYTFNLLLRCVRDCGLGDLETTQDVISRLIGERIDSTVFLESQDPSQLNKSSEISSEKVQDIQINEIDDAPVKGKTLQLINSRPNLLALKPHLGNILSLSELKKPEDRLLLLGGAQGFLETITSYKSTPDVKTFTLLIDCIPSTSAAEKQLIVTMKTLNVKPDIDFYNMLIKKKSMRSDYQGAKEVLKSMKQMKFRPNLITYGVLAIGCKTKEEALNLVQEMKSASYSLNSAILGAMLHQACYHRAYDYIFEIMELCLREQVLASKKMLEHLKEFKSKVGELANEKKLSKKEMNMFGIFKARYKTWLTEVQVDESENAHPWQQFRQEYPTEKITKYAPKDTARFKPRHSSHFKVRTSQKHINNNS